MNTNLRQRLNVEDLEDRVVPVTWPVQIPEGGVAQLLGTWGQYQENSQDGIDKVIHMHEGIDIPADAGAEVRAVMPGTVEAIVRMTDRIVTYPGGALTTSQNQSFIVIRDSAGARGWNYKHVVADPTLRVGDQVTEGMRIGTVATYTGYPPHIHLDRGESGEVPIRPFTWFSTLVLPAGTFRDPTIETSAVNVGVNQVIAEARRVIGIIDGLPLNERNTQVNRAIYDGCVAVLSAYQALADGFRYQYPPLSNPLTEFVAPPAGQPAAQDTRKPTVTSIDFRLAADDQFVPRADGGEQPRTDARYFMGQVTVGGQTLTRVGAYASAQAVNGRVSIPGQRAGFLGLQRPGGNIDFVVDAHDTFGTQAQAGPARLNPLRFDFSVSSPGWIPVVTSGTIPSFNFSGLSAYRGVNDFFNANVTRVAYENDFAHNSQITGPFYYNLTNTPNAAGGGGQPIGAPRAGDRNYYWNSDAAAGQPFAGTADAANNAGSSFPDGIYNVTVRAYDLSGNASDPKTVAILLTNWQRDIALTQRNYTTDDAIMIAGGNQYMGNQSVPISVLPAANAGWLLGVPRLAAGTQLAGGNAAATVTTNAAGQLPNQALGAQPAGSYYVVADYNGDGEYTEGLDAFTVVSVTPPPAPAVMKVPGPGAALASLSLAVENDTLVQGQTVHLVATVSSVVPSVPETPAGSVGFFADGQFLGSASISSGMAAFDVPSMWVGSHDFSALYFGDSTFSGAEGSESATVAANTTTTTLSADASTAQVDDEVTLTATVTKDPTPLTDLPSGEVDFYADGEYLASSPVQPDGTATLTISMLARGGWSLTAVYGGDTLFDGSEASAESLTILNTAPVVSDGLANARPDTPVLVNVLDYDADGDEVSVTVYGQGAHGSVSLTQWGFVYTADAGFTGTDTFTYTVDDGYGGTAVATVTVAVVAPAAIGGRIWVDQNQNGIQDAGESGPTGSVTVYLFDASGILFGSATTTPAGTYSFQGLLPGTYEVRVELPTAVTVSSRDQGTDDAVDSDFGSLGYSGAVALAAGDALSLDLGWF